MALRLYWHPLPRVAAVHLALRHCYSANLYWSGKTTLRPLRYSSLACHNSLHTSSSESEASEVASFHLLLLACLIVPLTSLTTAYGPGREETPSPGGPAVWDHFGAAQLHLLPLRTHPSASCLFLQSEWTSLDTEKTLATADPGATAEMRPPVSLLAHNSAKVRDEMEQVLLVAPYWPNQTSPLDSPS